MKFMLMLWGTEGGMENPTPEQMAAEMARWDTYTEELRAAGAHDSGEALSPSATSTTLRLKDGERLLSDGPFAETKEQVGGFYIIDCKDLDEAIRWAEKVPSAQDGQPVEIRPLMDLEAMREGAEQPAEARS